MSRKKLTTIICTVAVMASLLGGVSPGLAAPGDTGIPDYFNTPNWANSPILRKFVDLLPGLGAANANGLGQYIPVAVPDTTTYPGSDYYEIEVGEFTEQMHTDMPLGTVLRGYRQTNATGPTAAEVNQFHYLGPLIVSTKDRPIRIKFKNALPIGAAGDLFVPTDTTIMGSGEFQINYNPETKASMPLTSGVFTQNRSTVHLHGGRSPWISDGTPHQWITPAGETTSYPKGASVGYVPDMWFDASGNTLTECAGLTTCSTPGASNNPGPGFMTFYWTNHQSSRLMFYHDHAWGITRLGVYVGQAAGLIVRDATEAALISSNIIPSGADEIPLIIQDKTFVDAATVLTTDPTWNWGRTPGTLSPWSLGTPVTGDLWWPHVYMPAQNPYNPDLSGINAFGRWHYGPWFWPPTTNIAFGPVANPYYDPACDPAVAVFCQPPEMPGTPNPSWGAEAFMDTPVVNGTAYPRLEVDPKAYRFRVLNAAHDRFFNLQLYVADTDPAAMFEGRYTEVKMVPAVETVGYPAGWPTDGRVGGVPDPVTIGPSFIQIGTEGGFLPKPVVLPTQPINWNTDPTTFTAGLVLQQNQGGGTLMLGPAERADVIVDFSTFEGQTLILYNDAPAPWPALDPHYDYFTGAPDNRAMGGADTTLVGRGPNTRTIMQIYVKPGTPVAFNQAALDAAFTPAGGVPGVFRNSQEDVIVGQTAYNSTYNTTFPATWPNWGISRITDTAMSWKTPAGAIVSNYSMEPKAIQDEMGEVFDDYGRMSAKLGLEMPGTNAVNQNFILQNFVDPPTEIVAKNQVQVWKITHNGVDTHPVHFHFFEVQVLNRVGWDGFIYLPDENELGWKDTVRVSPLEDTIVALRPAHFNIPFTIPDSVRPLNPAYPLGSNTGFTNIDPVTGQFANPPVVNAIYNFGHEYVWHCHILSHEESDMMRPIVFNPNAKLDILWRKDTTGDAQLWYMDGTTRTGTATLPKLTAANWKMATRGDFNGDGKLDIVWRNQVTGGNVVWFMNGTTLSGAVPLNALAGANFEIVGTGDFNHDGKTDILWRNNVTGATTVWYMNGTTFVQARTFPSQPAPNWVIGGVGDFNNDGKPDILWRNISTGQNSVWYMNNLQRISIQTVPSLADLTWSIVGTGDFNNDVYPDILWRNYTTGENMVWFMKKNAQIGTQALLTNADVAWTIVD